MKKTQTWRDVGYRCPVSRSDKPYDITTDPHWTDNHEFPPVMRVRKKHSRPMRDGYADRKWKRENPDLFLTDTTARRHARRHATAGIRKRIVKH